MGSEKLTKARRDALALAASDQGLPWYRGDRAKSTACNWLFKQGFVEWRQRNREQVLVATPAGRSALSTTTKGEGDE